MWDPFPRKSAKWMPSTQLISLSFLFSFSSLPDLQNHCPPQSRDSCRAGDLILLFEVNLTVTQKSSSCHSQAGWAQSLPGQKDMATIFQPMSKSALHERHL